jgi:predicted protein tyrosine phosphatase
MYKTTEALRERVMQVMPKVEELVETARTVAQEGRTTIIDIREKSNLILDTGHRQLKQMEVILSDAADRTQKQLAYAEQVVEDTLDRVESTVALIHKGVLKPIRGVAGITAGVAAALRFLMSRRPNPEGATLDEEMFI